MGRLRQVTESLNAMGSRKRANGIEVGGVGFPKEEYPDKELTQRIIGCAIRVHRELGPGYLEAIYENAMCHELAKQGLKFERQLVAQVFYDGAHVGEHRIDIFVEGKVVIELKSAETLTSRHIAQVISTLKAAKAKVGLLMNFDEAVLVNGIRRIVLSKA